MKKYLYQIPFEVRAKKEKTDEIDIIVKDKVTVIAINKRQAIAIAKDMAIRRFKKCFASREIEKVVIQSDKIEVKGSKEVNRRLKRKEREPMLPFNQIDERIKNLSDEVLQVGDQTVIHKVIIYDGWLKLKLLQNEKAEVRNDRLVIRDKENKYVKILVRNERDMPLFLVFDAPEPNKYSDKIDYKTNIEFLDGFGSCPYIPDAEKKKALEIASDIFEKEKVMKIIATIPIGKDLWSVDFVVLDDGSVGELSKVAQKRGLLIIKRKIKNINAGIRMYLLHICSRYLKTIKRIKGTEVETLGQLEEIDLWKSRLNDVIINLKKEAPMKELDRIIQSLEETKEKLVPQLEEIKKKEIKIGKWALKKAKILLKEKERIQEILKYSFIEISKLYDITKEVLVINYLFKEFIFGKSYANLISLIDKFKTIKVHFLDYPEDLKKVRKVEKLLLALKKKNGKEFKDNLKMILDTLIPILEGPIEYRIGKDIYLVEGGKVKCM